MSLARLASFVHKWLALLVGIQIVFWVVSGLFFTTPFNRYAAKT